MVCWFRERQTSNLSNGTWSFARASSPGRPEFRWDFIPGSVSLEIDFVFLRPDVRRGLDVEGTERSSEPRLVAGARPMKRTTAERVGRCAPAASTRALVVLMLLQLMLALLMLRAAAAHADAVHAAGVKVPVSPAAPSVCESSRSAPPPGVPVSAPCQQA